MTYGLPQSLDVGGRSWAIRWDYRPILEICAALNDPELSAAERAAVALEIFYPDFASMPPEDHQAAIEGCFWFISCGDEHQPARKAPRLVDWERDFPYIVAPINRVLGQEVRAVEQLHWWTFIGAYYEIGDCLFAQIVRIRDRLARGKPLDKSDREWYRQNRHLVDRPTGYTTQESETLDAWLGKKSPAPD